MVGKRIGIFFNNEMDDFFIFNIINYFGVLVFVVNFIKFGKRFLFFMCFSIVVDFEGYVKLVVGVFGGIRIIIFIVLVSCFVFRILYVIFVDFLEFFELRKLLLFCSKSFLFVRLVLKFCGLSME